MQLSQTFDRDKMFFFGQALPTISVGAKTLENETFQWLHEFYHNYQKHLGGSASAQHGAQVEFTTEDKVFSGYLTNMGFTRTATDRHLSDITFNMSVFDTKFTRSLDTHKTVKIPSSEYIFGLENISKFMGNQSALMRSRATSDPTTSLSSQLDRLGALNATLSSYGNTTFTDKSVPLRDAYPNEFPNSKQGISYDLLAEENAVSQAGRLLQNIVVSDKGTVGMTTFDLSTSERDNVVKLMLDKSAQLQLSVISDANTMADPSKAYIRDEDMFTSYVEPAPASAPAGFFARAGTNLGLMALRGVISSAAIGVASVTGVVSSNTQDPFDRMFDGTILGREPVFDDSTVFV
jgi:hypothetical protein